MAELSAPYLPMLPMEVKTSQPLDYSTPLTQFIADNYGEVGSYKASIDQIQQLRIDMLGAGKDATGRDIVYKYYGQLELLELHFPFGSILPIEFQWHDAVTKDKIAQNSIAFEKACTIFNLAAILSHIGAAQVRTEESGLKTACSNFEAAAGVFKYISDNFLHAPSTDMSKDFITVLVNVMLGQAQECFVDKVVAEKKKSAIIMKLASQVSAYYQTAVDSIALESLKNYAPAQWKNTISVKCKYFAALASYHASVAAEQAGKYGEQVARLGNAVQLTKEALKIVQDSSSAGLLKLVKFTTTKQETNSLEEAVKSFQLFLQARFTSASKDNDLIYHENVPAVATLTPVDKTSMVQAKKLVDVFPNMPQIVGKDLFESLVPVHVHEQSSLYSEEKAKVMREETARVDEANGDADAKMASMSLPSSLDLIKNALRQKQGMQQTFELPKDLVSWSESIQNKETTRPVASCFGQLDHLRQQCETGLKEAEMILGREDSAFREEKARHGDAFKQQPTQEHAKYQQLGGEVRQHYQNLEAGRQGDEKLKGRYEQHKDLIQLLIRGGQELLTTFQRSSTPQQYQQQGSLLDLPVEDQAAEAGLVNTVDGLVQTVYRLKKERDAVLAEMKAKAQSDDISKLLVYNKTNQDSVIKTELQKFNPYRAKIQANITEQNRLLNQLNQQHAKLLTSPIAKSLEQQTAARAGLSARFKEAKVAYDDLQFNTEKGLGYYQDVFKRVTDLKVKCSQFSTERDQERRSLISKISENYNAVLQSKLAQVNITSPTPQQQSQQPNYYAMPQQLNYSAQSSMYGYQPPQQGYGMPPYLQQQPPQSYHSSGSTAPVYSPPVQQQTPQSTPLMQLPSHLLKPLTGATMPTPSLQQQQPPQQQQQPYMPPHYALQPPAGQFYQPYPQHAPPQYQPGPQQQQPPQYRPPYFDPNKPSLL